MKYLLKPLTNKMIEQLRAARAIELSEGERNVCVSKDFRHSMQSLYRRGLIDTKTLMVLGRRIMNVYVTDEGKSFLELYKDV